LVSVILYILCKSHPTYGLLDFAPFYSSPIEKQMLLDISLIPCCLCMIRSACTFHILQNTTVIYNSLKLWPCQGVRKAMASREIFTWMENKGINIQWETAESNISFNASL